MHDYAIDFGKRRTVNAIIIGVYILVALIALICLNNWLKDEINEIVNEMMSQLTPKISLSTTRIFIKIVLSTFIPGIGIGLFYALYDRILWKCGCFVRIHKIPNLNGKWIAEVSSPMKGRYKPKIKMTIKQTWNKIQVNGTSEHNTSTSSESASILEQHGVMYFSYSYRIQQMGGQCYQGFNSLEIKDDELIGQYFSAKDVVNKFENCFSKKNNNKIWNQVRELAEGCGTKGVIIFRREER